VAATFVGLVFLMVTVLWFVEDCEEWWQWLVTAALALCVVAGALTGIARTAGGLLSEAGAGWVGMLLGRAGGASTHQAGPRALADAAVLVLCVVAGLALFRLGAARGELHWALEGLLLALAGVLFGLLPLVPRLSFLRSRRAGKVRGGGSPPAEDDPLVIFVLATCLGLGLSMGVSQGFASVRGRAPREVSLDAWAEGTLVDRPGLPYLRRVTLPLPAVSGPGELRLELELVGCAARLAGARAPLEPGQRSVELQPHHADVTLEPTSQEPATYRLRLVAGGPR
jgi:hypothetical protein